MTDKTEMLLNATEMERVSDVLKAMSHPTRLKILCYLGDQAKTVSDVLASVGTTQSNISQHIETLRKAGVIQSRRVHNKVYCSVDPVEVLPLLSQVKKVFCDNQNEDIDLGIVKMLVV
ncbi:MAG: winged helix-turn-helix transcriptional regulator [Gammaproteobacteria bacterium]|uniref:Winged helix-turn-helix transcriptional regulator n=1 Tax=Candidatus Thiopontia autotrophica TaxID=2841688 RepID=A0A8J6NYB9_9GAMM|nr:winged helix-turn-helix transcriptional regulator [Candidatus Thiopontia autotrophica]